MRNLHHKSWILIVAGLFFFGTSLHAQHQYKINDSKDIRMKLSGTSTLHKWEMNARTFTGSAQFEFKHGSESELKSINSLTFHLKWRT